VDKLTSTYFAGMEAGVLRKEAASAVQAIEAMAPKAEGLAAKLVGALRRNPILSAATAAAAGAGVATGVADAGAKKKDEERRREQIRQILMSKFNEGGYSA
jgi:hypothetical protein